MSSLVRDNQAKPTTPAVAEERAVTVSPRVDILETENEFLVLADVPGLKAGDVDIRFEKGELTLHGRRCGSSQTEPLVYHRVFSVNDQVSSDGITAELKAGVLTIHLPKVEAAKPKRITVKS